VVVTVGDAAGRVIALMFGGIICPWRRPAVAERSAMTPSTSSAPSRFFPPALIVVILTSFQSAPGAADALIILIVSTADAGHFVGVEVKGSRRWINLAGMSLQPSGSWKPALSSSSPGCLPRMPPHRYRATSSPQSCSRSCALVAGDFSQTMLIAIMERAFFMAGVPWIWIAGLGARRPAAFSPPTDAAARRRRIGRFCRRNQATPLSRHRPQSDHA
jgi:cell division protein FtsW